MTFTPLEMVTDFKALQPRIAESPSVLRHAVGDHYFLQGSTLPKRPPSDLLHAVGNDDRGQVVTTAERAFSDLGHAVGNGHGGQAAAAAERFLSDLRHALGNGHGGQAAAAVKRMVFDFRHPFRDLVLFCRTQTGKERFAVFGQQTGPGALEMGVSRTRWLRSRSHFQE